MSKLRTAGLVALGVMVGSFFVGPLEMGVSAEPGTQTDPLVTLSYVDKRVQELNTSMENKIDALEKELASQKPATQSADRAIFEIINAKKGTMIYLGASSEFILRSGEANAIASSAGGLSNLTQGNDIAHNVSIPKNNFILIPQNDGRGVAITEDAWVMIRGGYTIVKP